MWRCAVAVLVAASACKGPETELIEPLAVVNWYPSGNAPCVDRDVAVWVSFSEPLDGASLEGAVALRAGSDAVEVEVVADAENGSVSLTPTLPMDFGTVHTVELDATIRAASGDQLGAPVSSRFRTIPQEGCAGGVECLVDADCSGGRICSVTSACVSGCADDRDCPLEQTCGSGTCQ